MQMGHLKMLDGYIDLFMDPSLAECYLKLREELDKLVQKKVILLLYIIVSRYVCGY